MNKAKLIHHTYQFYYSAEVDTGALYTLVSFLSKDGLDPIPYINWLKNINESEDWIGGNIRYLRFEKNEIIIGMSVDNEDESDWFITTRENMLDILESWDSINRLQPRPDEVIFSQHGKFVFLEPIFYSEKNIPEKRLLNFLNRYEDKYQPYNFDTTIKTNNDSILGKSLLLKEMNNFYLLSVPSYKNVDLKKLSTRLWINELYPADPNEISELLCISSDVLTPYSLVNNETPRVKFLLDKEFLNYKILNFYPFRKDMMIDITKEELLIFFQQINRPAQIVDVPKSTI